MPAMPHALEHQHAHSCAHEHQPLETHHHHDHDEEHGHHHHHHHSHAGHRPKQRRALTICIALTVAMMLVEGAASFFTGSLMLLSDAVHMLSHAASLAVSLAAVYIAQRRTSASFSFGLYRVEVLAAFVNGIGLAGFCAWIVYESAVRISNPPPILGFEMMIVAVIGLAVNLTTAAILFRSGMEDLNTRSAFLHMLADTFSSVAIVIGGAVVTFTGWFIVDPLLSLVVAAVVAKWSYGLLRDSSFILLERAPNTVDAEKLARELQRAMPEICEMHDVHVWEITSQFVCMSAHVVLENCALSDTTPVRERIAELARERFGIAHCVVQCEAADH